MKQFIVLLNFITFIFSLTFCYAEGTDAEVKGLEIAKERKLRDRGWGDSQAEMVMTLKNKHGKESIRHIRTRNLEVQDDGDKALSIFDRPRDVKGTAFLNFSHIKGNDDQWLYLPALKRVKRISSRNKSGPFMGSEFAYEDLSSFEIEKFTFKLLGEEACGKLQCFKIESRPSYKHSGYTRIISLIDTSEYRAHQVDYYDRKNSHLKTLTFTDYHQYKDKFWRAHQFTMINHQTGKSTRLEWKNYQFSTGLSSKDFNKNVLKRIR